MEPTEEHLRRGLELARQQIARGDVGTRDIEAIVAEAKRRYSDASDENPSVRREDRKQP